MISLQLRDARRVRKTLGKLPDTLQKKVLREAIRRTNRETILPKVKDKIRARSFDPPSLRYPAGKGEPMVSHTGRPGILRDKMTVRSIKRTRKYVGSVIVTPTREQLGIDPKYKGYYPAFLEYRKSPIGNAPQPYLRGTFRQNLGLISREFSQHVRNRIRKHWRRR